ncbi:putative dihydrolipoyllysine-residue succinyltransferase domain protein, partial [Chlamydia psittaci 84-8471/1]
YYGDRKR